MEDNLKKARHFPVKIVKLGDDSHDIKYWASLSGIERLQQLEELRQNYNNWKYGRVQGFQRVYRIIKTKDKK
jgi:hypothetical protein